MKKNRIWSRSMARVAAIAMVLFILVTTLAACGGGTATVTVDKDKIAHTEGTNGLSKDDLQIIANLAANNASLREQLTAALRGYDMTAEKFDDSKIEVGKENDVTPEVKATYAVNVLKKATEGNEEFKVDLTKFNYSDLESVINSLKTTISTENPTGIGAAFDTVQRWIGIALGWMTNTIGFGNYLIGICIFAIIVEILLIPLGIKQQKNSIKQAKLRPKEMAIRNKYKGRTDQATQQKITQEIQELYQKEHFSPASGCLPLLIQLPIIMILYNIVVDPLHYVLGLPASFSAALSRYLTTAKAAGGLGLSLQESGRGTIEVVSLIKEQGIEAFEGLKNFLYFDQKGLEACFEALDKVKDSIPNLSIGSLNFAMTPNIMSLGNPSIETVLLLVPVLTFVIYFFSMKITKKFTYQPTTGTADDKAMGCSNKMMDFMMPALSVFFTFSFPAVLGIYWIFKSILSTIKQIILHKLMPTPKFTDEDYKAAEKEYASKTPSRPSRSSGSSNGERPRSLHYIDADDDEVAPAPAQKSTKSSSDEKKFDEVADKKPQEEAPSETKAPAEEPKGLGYRLFGKSKIKKKVEKKDEDKPEDEVQH